MRMSKRTKPLTEKPRIILNYYFVIPQQTLSVILILSCKSISEEDGKIGHPTDSLENLHPIISH